MNSQLKRNIVLSFLFFSCLSEKHILSLKDTLDDIWTVSPYVVHHSVEQDEGYRSMLEQYVFLSMTGCDDIPYSDSLATLCGRKSFMSVVSFVLDPENDDLLDIYYEPIFEQHERWEEYKSYLISNCKDREIQYKLADYLLKRDIDIGLVALWDRCNTDSLPSYDFYKNKLCQRKDGYGLLELCIIQHNYGNRDEEQSIMYFLKLNVPILYPLARELTSKATCSYYEYISELANVNM